MKTKRALLVTALALLPAVVQAEKFQIDLGHSRVGFGVRHMAVSTVRGSFLEYSGSVEVDLESLANSSVEVTIVAASIDTRHEGRDNDLRDEAFFDVENYPEITFRSTSIEQEGDDLVAVGDLTIKGNTKSVHMPVEISGPIQDPWGNTRMGVSGRLTIDRTDFGLNYNRMLEVGGLVVGKEVEIEIDVELVKAAT